MNYLKLKQIKGSDIDGVLFTCMIEILILRKVKKGKRPTHQDDISTFSSDYEVKYNKYKNVYLYMYNSFR